MEGEKQNNGSGKVQEDGLDAFVMILEEGVEKLEAVEEKDQRH